ncbi:hypothetical protein AGMMS49992_29700 [Clostridia bacterium]|nr:hypothetical protein AGMMS49992_29700 [Clostridia bacterium]
MGNRFCMNGFVFTNAKEYKRNSLDYKWYIPLFLYSIFKSYPDYDARIYVTGKIPNDMRELIKKLHDIGNFEIIENFKIPGFNPMLFKDPLQADQAHRASRWLLFDEAFMQYEAAYMGDIDIFICKDPTSEGLFEQHKRHCEFLGVPYSNGIRNKPIHLPGNNNDFQRLSGLHFTLNDEYFRKVEPAIRDMIKELNSIAKSGRLPFPINNEHILYRLAKNAGIPLPSREATDPILSAGRSGFDPESYTFRPHHGLHLSVFRSNGNSSTVGVAKSETYRYYYEQFVKMRDEDELLRLILKKLPSNIKDLFKTMDRLMAGKA